MGDLPIVQGQQISATVVVNGQLDSAEEFGDIVLRANIDGSTVRLRDVARIELGGQNYATSARLNGNPSTGIGVQLSPTGNALATATAVHARMAELSKYFPKGMKYEIPYDSSRFIRISIAQVVETLLEAMALVFLVMYLFLQSFRYTLIPAIVVPVALMGAFTLMFSLGYTINVLTMFAMVLAVGILVDDAIVVIENVERIMSEEGLSPREATRKAMGQITAAIIGITVTLAAVFIPMAFFAGSVGNIYRQFSLVMVSSMMFSAFLAMSLTPALCATLLKPVPAGHHLEKRGFWGWFNRGFKRTTHGYEGGVAWVLKRVGRMMVVFVLLVALVVWMFLRLPASFLPNEDQGYLIVNVQLPPGATQGRTLAVMKQVEGFMLKQPEVQSMVSVMGFSFSGQGQNAGLAFVPLKDWSERKGAEHSSQSLAGARVRCADGCARRLHLCAGAAVDPRTRHRHRLQLPPAGSRRQRPRGAAGGAQPDARHGRPEQDRHRRAARRPGRRAAAADRHRPRPRGRTRRVVRGHQRGAQHGARLGLRQRLPQPRPPAARGGAGRRAGAHAARPTC